MAGKSQQKVLRIGIIEDGKIVQERLIKAGETVTVGESAKNTFVFPKTHLPRAEYPLFVARSGKYVLNFTEQMKGKISSGGSVVGLDKLRSDPSVQSQGGSWRLPLTEQDRGKITVDNVTVLFQFVAPPPVQAVQPIQNMDFRPPLLQDDDPVFLGFLAIFSAIAAVFVVWALNTEVPEVTSLEQIPDRFTQLVMKPEEPIEPVEDPTKEEIIDENAKAEKVDKKKEETPKEKPKEKPKNKVDAAKQQEALKQSVMQKSLLLKMLTTRGESGRGFAEDLFAEGGDQMADLDAALEGVGGVEVASAESELRQGKGGDTKDADIGDLAGVGGGTAEVGSGPATKIEGKTELGAGDAILDEGDVGSVKKTVQRNFGQLTYCYEQRLRQNPSLAGRVEIEWYVNGGRVTSAEVFANTTGDSELGQCIVKKIKRWSFPSEVQGEILYPFIFKPKG